MISEQQQELARKLLTNPLFFPDTFRSWVSDSFAVDVPQLPLVQTFGGRGLPRYLDISTTSVTAASGGTAETTMYSVTVPGRRVGIKGTLAINLFFKAECEDATNTSNVKLKINGTLIADAAEWLDASFMDGTIRYGYLRAEITNAGSYQSQYAELVVPYLGNTGLHMAGGAGSGTEDLSQDFTVSLTQNWAGTGGQTVVKTFASTEVFNPIGFS